MYSLGLLVKISFLLSSGLSFQSAKERKVEKAIRRCVSPMALYQRKNSIAPSLNKGGG